MTVLKRVWQSCRGVVGLPEGVAGTQGGVTVSQGCGPFIMG